MEALKEAALHLFDKLKEDHPDNLKKVECHIVVKNGKLFLAPTKVHHGGWIRLLKLKGEQDRYEVELL